MRRNVVENVNELDSIRKKDQEPTKETPFWQSLLPVLVLIFLVVYGLVLRSIFLDSPALPLEIVFILAAAITIGYLRILGHRWLDIQKTIVNKLSKAMPAFLILFSIGLIIASWIVCGTIPMMVYWGLKIIDPNYLYLVALAADVDLFDHIQSMMFTTVPSTIMAAGIYSILGFIYPPAVGSGDLSATQPYLDGLSQIFNFNVLLLLPPLIVLIGSFRKMPTVPVLISSVIVACVLSLLFQKIHGD